MDHLSYGPYFYPAPIDDPHVDPTDDIIFNIDSTSADFAWLINVPDRHRIYSDSALKKYILRSTAPVLKEILESEFACLHYDPVRKFLSKPPIAPFLWPKDDKARHLCDECMTSLFNVHYSCSVCAKEICYTCFQAIPDSVDPSDNEFLTHINAPKDTLERCLVRGKGHCKSNFLTISKYSLHALKKMYAQVLSVLEKGVPETPPPPAIPKFDPT
ncbi:hypothetical protein HDU81_001627, partial [Chytriomyces hyalinus]